MRPHLERPAAAGQAGTAVVVPADPGDGQQVTGKTREPRIPAIVGGAGLAGDIEVGRQVVVGAAASTFAHHCAQGIGQQVCRLQAHRALVFQRVALERIALGINHLADTAQGHTETAGRYSLVHRSHIHGRVLTGAQGECGHFRDVALYSQAAQHVDHRIQAEVHAQPRGRQVIGIGQGVVQQYVTVHLAVEIAGLPCLAARPRHFHRGIGQHGYQGVAPGLLQGGQVDSRFQQRARRPARVQCAVETGVANTAAAHQCRHLTGVEAGNHRGAFQCPALVELVEHGGGTALYLALQQRVERRENTQAKGGQVLLAILLPQLPPDQVEVGRKGIANTVLAVQVQRPGLGGPGLLRGNHAPLGHFRQYHIAPLQRPFGIAHRVVQ